MADQVIRVLVIVSQTLQIVGAGALVLGFAIATVRYVRQISHLGASSAYDRYRMAIGRVVLIGLEVLVAATIIKTITVAPTVASLGLLAAMIAIRTILSWSTVLEMTGRWPWQRKPAAQGP